MNKIESVICNVDCLSPYFLPFALSNVFYETPWIFSGYQNYDISEETGNLSFLTPSPLVIFSGNGFFEISWTYKDLPKTTQCLGHKENTVIYEQSLSSDRCLGM